MSFKELSSDSSLNDITWANSWFRKHQVKAEWCHFSGSCKCFFIDFCTILKFIRRACEQTQRSFYYFYFIFIVFIHKIKTRLEPLCILYRLNSSWQQDVENTPQTLLHTDIKYVFAHPWEGNSQLGQLLTGGVQIVSFWIQIAAEANFHCNLEHFSHEYCNNSAKIIA